MPIILDRTEDIRCIACGRGVQPGEQFCGPNMWHCNQPTCRHPDFYNCPECARLPRDHPLWRKTVVCPVPDCGCETFYT